MHNRQILCPVCISAYFNIALQNFLPGDKSKLSPTGYLPFVSCSLTAKQRRDVPLYDPGCLQQVCTTINSFYIRRRKPILRFKFAGNWNASKLTHLQCIKETCCALSKINRRRLAFNIKEHSRHILYAIFSFNGHVSYLNDRDGKFRAKLRKTFYLLHRECGSRF